MAARRLLIVMLVLLGVSTVAAALAPPRPGERDPAPAVEERPTPARAEGGGRLVRRAFPAQAERPERIRVAAGDQLALTVRSRRVERVEIPALGLSETAAPLSPARFDLLVERRRPLSVRLLDGPAIATIEVAPARERAG